MSGRVRLFKFRFVILFFTFISGFNSECFGQSSTRNEIKIPDIRGYVTLKCDFHMHTVFSDGKVWPSIRVQEAWRDGLDAISITDHIEYKPFKKDVSTDQNKPYEIALPFAESSNLLLIKGAEITRDTPPGHHNAIFLSEIDSLDRKDFFQAVGEAEEQGAFIFYNHPGWKHPQGIAEWFDYQTKLFDKGWLYGIEVVNGNDYYPLAHKWCIEKKLTLMGDSDSHNPISFDYDNSRNEHRPVTLVFAKKRTLPAIKEALFARRTAIWWKGGLIGDKEFLSPIFHNSIEIVSPQITFIDKEITYIQIHNDSDIDYEIETTGESELVSLPKHFVLYGGKTSIIQAHKKAKNVYGRKTVHIPVIIKNLYTEPEQGMADELDFSIRFEQAGKK